nr:phage/plasmid primase, P4 family [Defluviimonas salinarum]
MAAGTATFGAVDLTEVSVADAFVNAFHDRLRYNCTAGHWLAWDSDRWRRDETGLCMEMIKRVVRAASAESKGNERRSARKAAFVSGVERLARTDTRVAVTADMLDANPMILSCSGCYVDLETGRQRPPDPTALITRKAGVAPKDGPCPRFIQFLLEASGGDDDMLRFFQVLIGYILTGRTSEHVLVFFFGPGGNGKSVFLNIVTRMLGEYGVTSAMDTFVAARGERHLTELAMLAGARLVTASETQEGRSWDEPRIKSLTGGDPITARFMRQDNFTFRPQFKLILSGNHQPMLRNVDPAIRRRFLIVPFTRTPARPDPDLEEKLWAEAPQILQWAIRGCLEWQEEGLPRPAAIRAATDSYFSDMDLFGEWLSEKCLLGGTGDATPASQLFASWKVFAEAAGERPGTAKALGARLRRQGLENGPERVNGKVAKVWRGIALREVDL